MLKKQIKKYINRFFSTLLCMFFFSSCVSTKVLALTTKSIPSWNSSEAYTGGMKVQYDGKVYEAKWWTKDFIPNTKVQNDWDTPWKLAEGTTNQESTNNTSTDISKSEENNNKETINNTTNNNSSNSTNTNTGTDKNSSDDIAKQTNSTIPSWNSSEVYTGGMKVQYDGKVYEAKWWTKDFIPNTKVQNDWDTPWKLADKTTNQESTNPSTSQSENNNNESESTNQETNNTDTIVYPDYSQVDVGEGIEWKDNIFAPFVDSTAWPAFKLSDVSRETKVPYYNLGFIVSKSAKICEPSWGTYYSPKDGPLNQEIKKIREMGGDVIVSFGGASNVPLQAAAPNAEVLKEQYKRFIKAYKLTRIDFDIEGMWIRDTKSLKRNNEALKMLQDELKAEGYNLDVWFTLPVLPSGLDNNGVNVLEMALDSGVIIDGVNVMTMDYGDSAAPNPREKMGEYGIEAITNLHSQLKKIYSDANIKKSDSNLWKMIGTTPMIGMNDIQTEIFNLEDAKQTLSFAKEKGIGMLSMWSANRDKANPKGAINSVEITSSSIVQEKFEFSKIFNNYNEDALIIEDDTDTINGDMTQQTTGAIATWNSSESYTAGTKVKYNGKVYEAKWWTKDYIPNAKFENDWETPWKIIQ